MKKIMVSVLLSLAMVVIGSSWGMANWKQKVTRNQVNAKAYIEQLMMGANPDSIERPHVRYDDKYQAKRANREIREAMDDAEELARQGKHDEITMPDFKSYLSDERFDELERGR